MQGSGDGAIRAWERALAGGDEQARLPLASAYQRLGRLDDALALLAELRHPDPATAAFLSEAWRGRLGRLAPARRVDGARPYGELWGWAGGRAVLLSSLVERDQPGLLGAVCWERAEFVYEAPPTRPGPGVPIAAQPDALWLPGEPGRLERLELASGLRSSRRVAAGGRVLELDRACARALIRYLEPGRRVVVAVLGLTDGSEQFFAQGGPRLAAVPNWAAGWIAWGDERAPLRWAPLPPDGSPAPAPEVLPGARGHLTPLAAVGRHLLVWEPGRLLLLDPLTGERHPLDFPGRGHGPWRLSRDERFLLGYRLGLPLAVPLGGGPARELASTVGLGIGHSAWHPQVDVVALGRRGDGAELRAASGELWLTLPRDSQPLGWAPDGCSLVVMRRLGSVGGLLELWTPGGSFDPAP